MTGAFCPGHITCFFHPVRTDDPVTTGSRGAGLRLSSGTRVVLEERTDGSVKIVMDGAECEAPISRSVLSSVCPGTGFDVTIENDLPVGQGFGMSASGAIAVAAAACAFKGLDVSEAFRYAHVAEVAGGGGLGDVAAISCRSHQPVRVKPGIPPHGEIIDTGVRFKKLTLAIIGNKLSTSSVINDPVMQQRMQSIGSDMVDDYVQSPCPGRLFAMSRYFSQSVGVESEGVKNALDLLSEHGPAGMCMLGNSIFTTLSEDDVREILGDGVEVFTSSTSDVPVTQKA